MAGSSDNCSSRARRAVIVYGGWQGHQPDLIADIFAGALTEEGFGVTKSDQLDTLLDADLLADADLLIPLWTIGEISKEQTTAATEAVAAGLGLAGCHGGMCDAFRNSTQWQFMTGGNWVSHPGGDGVDYTVNIRHLEEDDELALITTGLEDFAVSSEQYYLHVDPAVRVLATTRFPSVTWYHSANPPVDMPVVWCKRWGLGRVFYNSLGHQANVFDGYEALELMRRGFRWAAASRAIASESGETVEQYASTAKMF